MRFPLACCALSLCLAGFAGSGWAGDADSRRWRSELALGHDSNVANARQGGNERDAMFALASIGAESAWPLSGETSFNTLLRAEGQAHDEYPELNSARGMVQLRLVSRPGQGFFVPTMALSGSAVFYEFDSRARDGSEYRASAFLLEQLTTRISARLTLASAWRSAEAAAFETHTRSAGLDLDWILTSRCAAYGGYQYRRGDFVTTAPTVPAAVAATARAVSADDAFPGEFAVLQDGSASIGTLGVNLALSPRWSVDLQGLFVEAESDLGVRYRRLQTMASLLGRF